MTHCAVRRSQQVPGGPDPAHPAGYQPLPCVDPDACARGCGLTCPSRLPRNDVSRLDSKHIYAGDPDASSVPRKAKFEVLTSPQPPLTNQHPDSMLHWSRWHHATSIRHHLTYLQDDHEVTCRWCVAGQCLRMYCLNLLRDIPQSGCGYISVA